MAIYIVKRFIYMLVVLVVVSVAAFLIINLPPGDYVTSYIMELERMGQQMSNQQAQAIRAQYGLDKPLFQRYFFWIWRFVRGDLGMSLLFGEKVADLIASRLPMTLLVSLLTVTFTYVVAIPIGIFSATHQYTIWDYILTVVGFVGIAVPNFLLALIVMFFYYEATGVSIGGLFSQIYQDAPWSLAKVWDLIKHLPVPMVVIGAAGTAGIIRVMRGCLLDELKKQYVVTARAKGVGERTVLMKYPVRVALNPIVSTIGWLLPAIFSGQTIAAIVLNLPTLGPLLLQSLKSQDMHLAGSTVMILTFLTVIGTFLSDLLLVSLDPRIRFEKAQGA